LAPYPHSGSNSASFRLASARGIGARARPAALVRLAGDLVAGICLGGAVAVLAQLAADAASGSQVRTEPVRAAQVYLREHLDSPLRVDDLAARVGLSTSHFSALFRRATGGGVVEYVKRLRIARASELLVTSAMPVADIARAVGYDDAFYFARQFRRVQDCSPTEFRRRAGT